MKRLTAVLLMLVMLVLSSVPSVAESSDKLSATVTLLYDYCVAGRDTFESEVAITGGTAPYRVDVTISLGQNALNTNALTLDEAGQLPVSYAPQSAGRYTVSVRVKDAEGTTADAKGSINVSAKVTEGEAEWAISTRTTLTGDWRHDLIAVAATQLGYKESTTNTIEEGGVVKGYTRYGHWMNVPYVDWCAAFVSFCWSYAKLPYARQLKSAGVSSWIATMKELRAYHAVGSGYQPRQGDIVFLVPDQDGSHMGIIEYVAEDYIGTIEGNASDSVDRRVYEIDGKMITGYTSMAELMLDQGHIIGTQQVPISITVTPLGRWTAQTVKKSVNLRYGPGINSVRVVRIENKGTHVTALARLTMENDEIWYLVSYRGRLGYIRSDLLKLAEAPEETPVPEESAVQVLEEPKHAQWQVGDSRVVLVYRVSNAVAYRWQRGNGQRWEYIPDATSELLMVEANLDTLSYSYRCIATGEDGTTLTSREVSLLPDAVLSWLRSKVNPTDDLLIEKMQEEEASEN